MTSSLSQKVQFLLTAKVYTACLSPNLADCKKGLRLPDQRYRLGKLQIYSDDGGGLRQQATVIRGNNLRNDGSVISSDEISSTQQFKIIVD
jgi:hypothetical protein